MGKHKEKASILIERSRYEMAQRELMEALLEDPKDGEAQALLGICLSLRRKFAEAIEAGKSAVAMIPDDPYIHFLLSQILYNAGKDQEAQKAAEEALKLDPKDPHYYEMVSNTHYGLAHWQAAVSAGEKGLQHDPHHLGCRLALIRALLKIARYEEAEKNIQVALVSNPAEPRVQAAMGWVRLGKQKTGEALLSFQEALRLEPGMEWARIGLLQALKARNRSYGFAQRYLGWLTLLRKFTGHPVGQWLMIPIAVPLVILYVVFVFIGWVLEPLFNLTLRWDLLGRMALSKDEIKTSDWVAGLWILGFGSLIAVWITKDAIYVLGGIWCFFLIFSVRAVFQHPVEAGRIKVALYSVLFGVLGLVGLAGVAFFLKTPGWGPAAFLLWLISLVGAITSHWYSNFVLLGSMEERNS